jgi:hypothetical protein
MKSCFIEHNLPELTSLLMLIIILARESDDVTSGYTEGFLKEQGRRLLIYRVDRFGFAFRR